MPEEKTFKVTDRRTAMRSEDDPTDPGAGPELDEKPSYVKQLEDRAARAEEQLKQYIRAYKQEVEVGLAQTKDRLQREAERELLRLRGELATELIPVLDNLDRSLAALRPGLDAMTLAEGLRLVQDQFLRALSAIGITPIDPLGEDFDPRVHEANGMQPVSDPAASGKVLTVLRPGYLLADRVLRPALVQVGRLVS